MDDTPQYSPEDDSREANTFTWDDSYAIARSLMRIHTDIQLEEVSLGMIYRWTLELPEFQDDHELANEGVLAAIYQEWYEEANPL